MYADLYEMDPVFGCYEYGCHCISRYGGAVHAAREPTWDEENCWAVFGPYIPPTCPTDNPDPTVALTLLGAGGPL